MSDGINESVERFRFERDLVLEKWPAHLTEPLLALPKRTRQALGQVVDLALMQIVEWQEKGRVKPDDPEDTTSVDDIIFDLQMITNLMDDESNFDGSDPDYTVTGWLRIDPMDPNFALNPDID